MNEDAAFDTTVDLDSRNGTLIQPARVDAGDGATHLVDSQASASVTEVVNFGDNDRVSLRKVTDRNGDGTVSLDDVDFRVVDGDATIEVDDGAGAASRIVLRNVGGDALSLADFNAIPNLGPVTLGTAPTQRAASVFLADGRGVTVDGAADVFGRAGGEERLVVTADARDVRTDANIERIDLDVAFDEVAFDVTPDGLTVSTAGATRLTIPSLNQTTDVRFADGNATLTQTGARTFRLDGGDLGTAFYSPDGGVASTVQLGDHNAAAPELNVPGPAASVFMNPGATVTVFEPVRIFGRASDHEAVILAEGASDVAMDANVERLDVPRDIAALDFTVTGDGLEIAAGATVLATLPSLNQPAELRFADGDATLAQTGAQTFVLTGDDGGTATIDTDGLTGDITLGDADAERVDPVGMAGASEALEAGMA
jgi:hypothetical protein